MQIEARLDPHSLEHGDQSLDRRVARARAHARERGVDTHRARLDAGDRDGDATARLWCVWTPTSVSGFSAARNAFTGSAY